MFSMIGIYEDRPNNHFYKANTSKDIRKGAFGMILFG